MLNSIIKQDYEAPPGVAYNESEFISIQGILSFFLFEFYIFKNLSTCTGPDFVFSLIMNNPSGRS